MELDIKGVDDLRAAVDRLTMCAKTLMMAADKIDEALAAHIGAMTTFMEATNGLQNRGTGTDNTGDSRLTDVRS